MVFESFWIKQCFFFHSFSSERQFFAIICIIWGVDEQFWSKYSIQDNLSGYYQQLFQLMSHDMFNSAQVSPKPNKKFLITFETSLIISIHCLTKRNKTHQQVISSKKKKKNCHCCITIPFFSFFHSIFWHKYYKSVFFLCVFILSFFLRFLQLCFVFIHQNSKTKHTTFNTTKTQQKHYQNKNKKITHKNRHQMLCIQFLLYIIKTHIRIYSIYNTLSFPICHWQCACPDLQHHRKYQTTFCHIT